MTSSIENVVGWHGKLPAIGDFATRRLNADFVSMWDAWLSNGLEKLRHCHGTQWTQVYLASPAWRFMVTTEFFRAPLSNSSWAGVVIPSVDRVGRYYPLTLAYPLSNMPLDPASESLLWFWLHRLEDIAVDAMLEDWTIDVLESELIRLGLPSAPVDGRDVAVRPPHSDEFFQLCEFAPRSSGAGSCAWFSESNRSSPVTRCSLSMDDSILGLWVPQPDRGQL